MAAATGYKVNSGGTYVDLNTLFEPGSGGPASGYKIAGTTDLNAVFAPYVSGPQAIQTNYKNASGNDLNIVFSKLKKWSFIGSSNFGFNDIVRAFIVDSLGNIYVGGDFTALNGGTPGTFNYIAKMAFNSTTWTTVGSGAGGFNNRVYALAIDSNNNLYAGGQFSAIFGGTVNTLNRVARSVGGSGNWATIGTGTGLNGNVYALAIDSNNKLYAGDQFTAIFGGGANTLTRVASSVGGTSNWATIGSSSGLDNIVFALAVDSNNNLYAGGRFTAIFGGTINTLNCVARSAGGTGNWSTIGSSSGLNNDVLALTVDSAGNLYAGGQFTAIFGGTANTLNRIARSAGGTGNWSTIGSSSGGGFDGTVNAVVTDSNNNLYAGGSFTAIFGGTINTLNRVAKSVGGTGNWTTMSPGSGSGFDNIVYTLEIDTLGNLYAGGSFTAIYGGTANTLNSVAKYA